jgi:Cu2+-exporting ATPase
MASVLTNNVAALGALANGVLPLRKVAQLEAERRHRLEMAQFRARGRNPVQEPLAVAARRTVGSNGRPT